MLLFIRSRWEDMRTQVPLGFRKPTVKTTLSCLIWAKTGTFHFFLVPQQTSNLTLCFVNLEKKGVKMENYQVSKVGKEIFCSRSAPPFQTVLERVSALMRSLIPNHLWILKLVHPQRKMGIICFYSCLWDLPNFFFLFWCFASLSTSVFILIFSEFLTSKNRKEAPSVLKKL